jgi:hypothetical protein
MLLSCQVQLHYNSLARSRLYALLMAPITARQTTAAISFASPKRGMLPVSLTRENDL